MYVVFRCRKCGRYLYAEEGSKSRRCVCGHVNSLRKVTVITRVEEEREAGELVRFLQQKSGKFQGFRPLG